MRNTSLLTALLLTAGAASLSGQTPAPSTLRLSVDEAVKMALDHNLDLAADRLDPQIGDTRVAAAAAAYRPTFTTSVQQNDQLQPPANFLFPIATRTNALTSSAGVSQRVAKYGTAFSVSWTGIHTSSDSVLNSYNPLLQSGLSLSVSQPLYRDLKIDAARQLIESSHVDRAVADTRLRESIVHTTADVKTAYWNLASAMATVDARRSALDLAQELVRVNKAKVDVGSAPPLDLVSAQAEVASDEEQLIISETAVKEAEDRLRLLIFDGTDRSVWNVTIEPIDPPPVAMVTVDVETAVTTALRERADLDRSRKDIESVRLAEALAENQRLPDIRLNVGYQANGLGGTQVVRTGGFPGTLVGPGEITGFGSVLSQLFLSRYPTWSAGVSISHPIGASTDDANYARAKLEHAQAQARLKGAEARVIQQVRDAGRKIEMNAKRIETTRVARELAEQRLDAERKRVDVGMSTSFLVIQAQRDLSQARTNEVSAVLAYDLSLVDFEMLQLASPAGQTSGGTSGSPLLIGPPPPSSDSSGTAAQAGGVRIPGLGQ